jgi:dihydrofolate synthase/folylpolyglutamate synthase
MVRRVAGQMGAPLMVVDEAAVRQVRKEAADWEGEDPQRGGRPGHGWCNLALALAVIRHLEPGLEPARLLPRLLQVPALPGRFWQPKPHVVADVAHNADKVAALAAHLELRFPGPSLVLVVGISRDRPLAEILAPLAPRARLVILSSASYAGRDPFALEEECHSAFPDLPTEVVEDPAQAVERAELVRSPDELVVVTGSAYTLDQAFNPDPLMKRMNAEYGRRGGNH